MAGTVDASGVTVWKGPMKDPLARAVAGARAMKAASNSHLLQYPRDLIVILLLMYRERSAVGYAVIGTGSQRIAGGSEYRSSY
jgi:hypothetical protein